MTNLERKGGPVGDRLCVRVNGDTWGGKKSFSQLQRAATAREAAAGFSIETGGQVAPHICYCCQSDGSAHTCHL